MGVHRQRRQSVIYVAARVWFMFGKTSFASSTFVIVILFRNKAIADYLASNGYTGTLSEFQKEADMVRSDTQKCPFLS